MDEEKMYSNIKYANIIAEYAVEYIDYDKTSNFIF